nr:MAG TPA: hypothetical protein [Crassvirales sp.]
MFFGTIVAYVARHRTYNNDSLYVLNLSVNSIKLSKCEIRLTNVILLYFKVGKIS